MTNEARRIVVTGLGVVSPLGSGEEFWQNLVNGKSGIRKITKFDASRFRCQIAGEAVFNPKDYKISKRDARRLDPFSQFAIGATKLALEDSGIDLGRENLDRIGVLIGSGIGGLEAIDREERKFLMEESENPDKISPFLVPKCMPNAASANVSILYKLKAVSSCDVTACAAGSHSIIDAYQDMYLGDADVMIAGGSEAVIVPLSNGSFAKARAMTMTHNHEPEKASMPFDAKRDGFVMGEGAGIVILEELKHAKERGARIYAEIIGYGTTSDGSHITAPDEGGEGARKAMAMALKKARLNLEEVDYINAHGTSTLLNDEKETLAIKNLFQRYAYKIPVSSTKSITGHLIGAAGGLEAVVCCLVLNNGVIPPTINYENPDPNCDLDYVPNEARKKKVKVAMNNSFGFGGHNAVLLLRKYGK